MRAILTIPTRAVPTRVSQDARISLVLSGKEEPPMQNQLPGSVERGQLGHALGIGVTCRKSHGRPSARGLGTAPERPECITRGRTRALC